MRPPLAARSPSRRGGRATSGPSSWLSGLDLLDLASAQRPSGGRRWSTATSPWLLPVCAGSTMPVKFANGPSTLVGRSPRGDLHGASAAPSLIWSLMVSISRCRDLLLGFWSPRSPSFGVSFTRCQAWSFISSIWTKTYPGPNSSPCGFARLPSPPPREGPGSRRSTSPLLLRMRSWSEARTLSSKPEVRLNDVVLLLPWRHSAVGCANAGSVHPEKRRRASQVFDHFVDQVGGGPAPRTGRRTLFPPDHPRSTITDRKRACVSSEGPESPRPSVGLVLDRPKKGPPRGSDGQDPRPPAARPTARGQKPTSGDRDRTAIRSPDFAWQVDGHPATCAPRVGSRHRPRSDSLVTGRSC